MNKESIAFDCPSGSSRRNRRRVSWSMLAAWSILSFLESHPSRISCASPPDQANGQSWSDGFGSSFGRCGPLLAHIASWRWRTSRFASNLPCGRCASSSDRLKTMATNTKPRRVHALPMSTLPAETRFSGARRMARRKSGTSGAGRWRGRPAGVELRRAPKVAVMQATNFGNWDDRAERRWLDRPSVGCILVERQVSASPVIVREVRGEDASQVPLAENDDMVQTLAPDRADESL